jgi:hypothetical protein
MNKKGAEMAIGTLVVIILSILVLVLIAFGFGMGWRNLWDKISGTFGGGVNVDSLKQACEYACTTQRTYEYCCIERSINYKDEAGSIKVEKGTCMNSLIKPQCDLTCSGDVCAGKVVTSVADIAKLTCTKAGEVCAGSRYLDFNTGTYKQATCTEQEAAGPTQGGAPIKVLACVYA